MQPLNKKEEIFTKKMKKEKFNILSMITSVSIILIFQLIDMLSCGPAIFFSSSSDELKKRFSEDEIDVLKKLGCLTYVYSCIISTIIFALLSKMEATVVSGIIVESLKPMVDSFSANILKETKTLNEFVTNYIFHLFLTTVGFSILSLVLYSINKAHYLSLIPKSIINGALGAIGIGQLQIALDCIGFEGFQSLKDSSLRNLFIICIVAVSLYFILEIWFSHIDYLIPAYFIGLVAISYFLSVLVYGKNDLMKNLRENKLIDSPETLLYPNYLFNRLEFSSISLKIVAKNTVKIFTMIFISSIHIAVNLPAFKMATGTDFDFSTELRTQGLSNLITFVPCYFIVSYSIAVFKSGGKKRSYSLIAGFLMIVIALYGVMIKGYIPRFALALVPGIMFVGFILSSFYETISYISAYEYFLSLLVTVIIKGGGSIIKTDWYTDYCFVIGVSIGFVLYLIMFGIFSAISKKKTEKIEYSSNDTDLLVVDYILWFLTATQFEKNLETKNKPKIILDFQKCSAIDWIGQDKLINTAEKYEEVVLIGAPFNLRHNRFSKVASFSYFADYKAYLESKGLNENL
ncbi:Sulfate Permease (SulP) Family [Pseudoloma neurophilia]|uniref:Sulfate Permease (SulP) Family n=1 Tax=Pseudoloma neurophilia TaxID=146866 RepID=A0A0R0M1M2_9MICR|nr:Sulfate Permease (SulP) Family [Pseudoloma neurophilia]